MSKISLSSNILGTGTLTIASPNTDTDRTLTLPDNSGTLLSNASTAGFPAGSVLQVVSTTKTDVFSTSSGSFVDITGLSATITPTSATSKIFVVVSMGLIGAVGGYMGSFALVRGATNLGFGNALGSARQVTFNSYGLSFDLNTSTNAGYSYLDSPSTTSSTTYKIQVCQANTTVTQTLYINSTSNTANTYNQTGSSTITLMEIAG